jgi:tetratricopeptide (TPR) repeat protein
VIETLEGDSACILWEEEVPYSMSSSQDSYIVTPVFESNINEFFGEMETTVPVSTISELLEFEKEGVNESCESVAVWKQNGDQVMRLADPSAALSFYEMALRLTSTLQIGSSVLVKESGYIKIAEVDCIDENSVDLSFPEDDRETSITRKEILLCILENDNEKFQERILLNISRCLLQLAEITKNFERKRAYNRSAVLGSSLAIAITTYHKNGETAVNDTEISAYLIRAKAQRGLQKFQHAIADAKKILAANKEHKEGQKLLRAIELQKLQMAKADKQLVREVSRYVENVMNDTVSLEESTLKQSTHGEPARPKETQFSWMSLIIVTLIAWILQKSFSKG